MCLEVGKFIAGAERKDRAGERVGEEQTRRRGRKATGLVQPASEKVTWKERGVAVAEVRGSRGGTREGRNREGVGDCSCC